MKLRDAAIGVGGDQYRFSPDKIQFEPGYNLTGRWDPLNDPDDVQLKASIKQYGVQTPLIVRMKDDVVYVVAGHRRLSAVKELISEGHLIEAVTCIAETRHSTDEDRDNHLLISNLHKGLNPLQKAEWIKRMMARHGWDEARAAEQAGITTKQVGNLLILAGAPAEIKEMVSDNTVSGTEAIKEIKRSGNGATAVLTEATKIAKEAGKTRVTAATTKAAVAPKAPPFVANSVLASLGVAPAAAPPPAAAPTPIRRGVDTSAKFKEYEDTLREVLGLDDLAVAKAMIRDVLGITNNQAA